MLVRFPELKLAYSEGQIGWIPYILERADDVWREHRAWGGVKDIVPEPPSTYYYRQVYGCFFRDVHGLESLHRVGVDNMTFETDYPHTDSTWPHTQGGRGGDDGATSRRTSSTRSAAATRSACSASTCSVAVMHDRLIPLDGPANFRDLGGYETDHGGCVAHRAGCSAATRCRT